MTNQQEYDEPWGGPEGDPIGTLRYDFDAERYAVKVDVSTINKRQWVRDGNFVDHDDVRPMQRVWHADVRTFNRLREMAADS